MGMINNPYRNALMATAYIAAVVLAIFYAPNDLDGEDFILIPIGMLSLFVFSVAVMGFLFVYMPVQLLIEGRKEEALRFFVKTLGTFAALTAFIFLALAGMVLW